MTIPIWLFILVLAILAAVVALVVWIITRRKDYELVSYMMDAMEDGELNFRFKEKNRFNRALNRIRGIFERQRQSNEQESWIKLTRVLTHEIMNTVTPIASLSDALARSMDSDGRSDLDVKAGLETISDSSKGLMNFVSTYRELSGVARAQRKALLVDELMERLTSLNADFAASQGAELHYTARSRNLMIYADESQISQVIINLIKNAVQAGARHIGITALAGPEDEVRIVVSNDGEPIPLRVSEQIFVPFFTTRQDGSGIGLSLSRQLMRTNGGTLELLHSTPDETAFLLTFR